MRRFDPTDSFDQGALIYQYESALRQKKPISSSVMRDLFSIINVYSRKAILNEGERKFIHLTIEYSYGDYNSMILSSFISNPEKDEFSENAIRHGAKLIPATVGLLAKRRNYNSIRKFEKLLGSEFTLRTQTKDYLNNIIINPYLSIDEMTSLIIDNVNLGNSITILNNVHAFNLSKLSRLLLLFPNIKIDDSEREISIDWDDEEIIGDVIVLDDPEERKEVLKSYSKDLFVDYLNNCFSSLSSLAHTSILYNKIDISAIPPILRDTGYEEILDLYKLAKINAPIEIEKLLIRPKGR